MAVDISWNTFGWIVQEFETPLNTAVSSGLSSLTGQMGAALSAAAILYIVLMGYGVLSGKIALGPGIWAHVLQLAVTVWFITSGAYQTYVVDFLFNGLPQWISGAVASGANVSSNSFDTVWIEAWKAGVATWRTLGDFEIMEKAVIVLFWAAALVAATFCFGVWLVSRVLMGLAVLLGPAFVFCALFPATKGYFERWLSVMAGQIVLQVGTTTLLSVLMIAELEIIGGIAGGALGADPWTTLQKLFSAIIFFLVAAFVSVHLPGWAAALAGGVSAHVGGIAKAVYGGAAKAGMNNSKTAITQAGSHAAKGKEAIRAAIGERTGSVTKTAGSSLGDASKS